MHREGRAPVRLADGGVRHVPHGAAGVVAIGRRQPEAREVIAPLVVGEDAIGDGHRRAFRRVVLPVPGQRGLQPPLGPAVLRGGAVLRLLEDAVEPVHGSVRHGSDDEVPMTTWCELRFSSLDFRMKNYSHRGLGAVSRGSHSFFDPPFSVPPLTLMRMVLIALLSTPGRVLPERMSFLL